MAIRLAFSGIGSGPCKAPAQALGAARSRRFRNRLQLLRRFIARAVAPSTRGAMRFDIEDAMVLIVIIGLLLVAAYRLAGAVESLQAIDGGQSRVMVSTADPHLGK